MYALNWKNWKFIRSYLYAYMQEPLFFTYVNVFPKTCKHSFKKFNYQYHYYY